eukprot:TRINITY_DN18554_c0_g1_i2.p1 TRINITY_DN18554_c0_g1~~TRINITY_DN18554_c0_g1_i2.p1  ORF type:complete len:251 (-),score=60.16 TRINITY_DN18554_c0_g1_i2:454-1206(-)
MMQPPSLQPLPPTRQRSMSGSKRVSVDEQSDEHSGLTPSLRGMAVGSSPWQSGSSPSKTPKLNSTDSPQSAAGVAGQVPVPLELGCAAEGEEMAAIPEAASSDRESSSSSDDDDMLEAMLAFHQQQKKACHKETPPEKNMAQKPKKPTGSDHDTLLTDHDTRLTDEDGWSTVKADKKPASAKKDCYRIPDDAYVDHDWSDDEGTWADVRDMAKSGAGGGKGKHSHQFKAEQARNCAIAKREAQRGGAARR